MKILALVVSLMVAVLLVGCGGNSRTTYAGLQEGFIAAVDPVVELREANLIDDRTYQVEIMPLIRTGNTALTDMDTVTKSGGDDTAFRDILRTVTRGLVQYYVAHQTR